ncbi:hypothetical protein EB810_05500 [Altererythrobacter sp. FM1]|uniref:hypothetical protein n=1 Tax=Tsuneonella flava TaxID=2055955 RepID=UPI000C805E81|nr:hypothetical protein [Tsuneonella flava]ROT97336.1 hypothetical protein EB810_05500 [Altererythrobacter sp. FM1]
METIHDALSVCGGWETLRHDVVRDTPVLGLQPTLDRDEVRLPADGAALFDELISRCPDRDIEHFKFRAVSPTFAHHPLLICGSVRGSTATAFACDERGELRMQTSADPRRKDY